MVEIGKACKIQIWKLIPPQPRQLSCPQLREGAGRHRRSKKKHFIFLLLLWSDQLSYLFLDHAELLVHCLEVISEEAGSVEQLLEVPQGDLAHRAG